MANPDADRARRAALRVIDHFGITKPNEIDLESIAWGLGVEITEATLKNCEAELIRKGKVGVIRVRRGEANLPRRRYSIGHELGHWELHPDKNQYWISTADQIHRYKGSSMEIEANIFASELLMPTPLFRPYCRRGTFGFPLADRLAALFQTSLQATALRMVDETDEPAVVVLSDGEQVCWSKRNQKKLPAFEYKIPRGMPLHHETMAWGASIDGDSGATEVPSYAWFPGLRDGHRHCIYEEVRYLETYDLALSLLVVHEE